MTAGQEALLQRLIGEKRPEQITMDFALCNRATSMQLIERERTAKSGAKCSIIKWFRDFSQASAKGKSVDAKASGMYNALRLPP